MEAFLRIAAEFETRIDLPSGFFNSLIAEDDWAFLIKTHALIEACITHAICATLGRPELEAVVARLDTANNQSGKLAFAKTLGLLDKPMRKYVTTLSQLRNEVVHNARSANFRFQEHWDRLTPEQHLQVCAALALEDDLTSPVSQSEIKLISIVNEFPKLGIGLSTAIVMSHLYTHTLAGDLALQLQKVGSVVIGNSPEALLRENSA